ncbi:hypothetical protein L6R53_16815 [Myxococcota bacterium]|nr:hypothetical protein [Myxococcota bacterium]
MPASPPPSAPGHALGGRLPGLLAELVASLLLSTLAAVALTWPLASDLSGQVIGGGELGGWLWRMWWHFEEVAALRQLDLPAHELLRQVIGLGRYPETGNILDVLLLSYPLDRAVGFPAHHNVKVLLILVGNGLCAYALARTVTPSRPAALAASLVAIFNPLVIQDINGTGLRQVLLWWVLLFPIALRRALRTAHPVDGLVVGLIFTLVSAFYWFYGLFTAMFGLAWLSGFLLTQRGQVVRQWRWLLPAAGVAAVGTALFLLPYFQAGIAVGPGGAPVERGGLDLPETTFFLPFPDYDVIASAPLRPTTAAENVLSSLHRVIESSWPADYVVNPGHGTTAFPLAVFLVGVLPALVDRRARPWLGIWLLFWLGTLGPFLKLGARQDTAEVVRMGEYVVRLPFTLMFQYVPGMSRMFGPYRMASLMVVASVPLVALGLSQLRHRRGQPLLCLFTALAIGFQPYVHIAGPVAEGSIPPPPLQLPLWVDRFEIPAWYTEVARPSGQGIVEMPFEQQQDLLSAYQVVHGQRVYYQNWATRTAVPPLLRDRQRPQGAMLRGLANEAQRVRAVDAVLLEVSRRPKVADLAALPAPALAKLVQEHGYRWLVVHEAGYLYVDVFEAPLLYAMAVSRLAEYLGQQPVQVVEFQGDPTQSTLQLPRWVPQAPMRDLSASTPAEAWNPELDMAIFDLQAWVDAGATPPPATTDAASSPPTPAPPP